MKTATQRGAIGDADPMVSAPRMMADESLIDDSRARLTPAQCVERKLATLLSGAPLPLSRLPASRMQPRRLG